MEKYIRVTRSSAWLGMALTAAGLSLGLAACETVYVQPSGSSASAHVDFPRDPELGRFGTGQIVSWASGPDCAEVLRISSYDPMTVGSKSFRLTAGAEVHLLAEIFPVGEGGLYTNIQCVNLISFTPEAGRDYTLLQTFRGGKCQTTVTDQASGIPVPNAVEHPLAAACVRIPPGYTLVG